MKASDWARIRLRPLRSEDGEPPVYRWLIPDHVDTTASNTLAAYDRLQLRGPWILGSAKTDHMLFQDHSLW